MVYFRNIKIPADDYNQDNEKIQEEFKQQLDIINQNFSFLEEEAEKIIKKVKDNIFSNYSSDPTDIIETISLASTQAYTVGEYKIEAQTMLSIYSHLHFCPKKSKYSEADRLRYTETMVLAQKRLYEKLKLLESKLDKKIIALQSILKWETQKLIKEL